MWQVAESDKRLVRYLLGDLSVEERDQFEELYFDDDALHDRLLAVEEELVDAYVSGDLSAGQRESFENFFLRSPERHEKVKFARALARFGERQTRSANETPSTAPPVQRSKLSLRELFDFSGFRWQFAFAGAALLIILAGATIWLNNGTSSRPVVSVTLFSFYRGGGDNLVSVPPGRHTVQLQLNLPADEYPSYRLAIRPAASDNSIEKHGLKSRVMPDGTRAVIASFPSEALHPGDYTLRLEGEGSNGEIQQVGGYVFRVERAQ